MFSLEPYYLLFSFVQLILFKNPLAPPPKKKKKKSGEYKLKQDSAKLRSSFAEFNLNLS